MRVWKIAAVAGAVFWSAVTVNAADEVPAPHEQWVVQSVASSAMLHHGYDTVVNPLSVDLRGEYPSWKACMRDCPNTPNTCLLYTSPSPRD